MSTAVVEPYNTVLATSFTMDLSQCVFLVDNEAIYDLCNSKLDIFSPCYYNLNRLLALTVGSITASLRFKGSLNTDFTDFQNNLVPYPRIHYPMISYAPISCGKTPLNHSVSDITRECFNDTNNFMKCRRDLGRYISCCLLYRGDVAPKDINAAITQIKSRKNIKFVDWSPTGFKVGINNNAPDSKWLNMTPTPRSLCMIYNTTAIQESWSKLNEKYYKMLQKQAFLHWYELEGMHENEFYEARDRLLGLELEYNSLHE